MANFRIIEKQVNIAKQIVDSLYNENNDCVTLTLPTGGGKSGVAYNVQRLVNEQIKGHSTIVMMHQKILQDQYSELFNGIDLTESLKGKDNYVCKLIPTISVSMAPCQFKQSCIIKNKCPYFIKRRNAIKANFLVTNYQLIFSTLDVTDEYDLYKNLGIYDECHNLEDLFTQYRVVNVSNFDLNNYKHFVDFTEKYDNFSKIGKEMINLISNFDRKNYISSFTEIYSLRESLLGEIDEYLTESTVQHLFETNKQLLNKFSIFFNNERRLLCKWENYWDNSDIKFIFDEERDKKSFNYTLTPLNVDTMFNGVVKEISSKQIYMSATIDNHKKFLERLGQQDKKSTHIEIDSDFNIENRKIFFVPIMPVNSDAVKNKEKLKPIFNVMGDIIEEHATKNESGVIFVPSYQFGKIILHNLEDVFKEFNCNVFFNENADERDLALQEFCNTSIRRRILISPSFNQGVNFKDNISRFQIIPKMFFKYLGSKVVQERMNKSQYWYEMNALIEMIQCCGRSVRHKEDHAKTYILDTLAYNVYKRRIGDIPKWFNESTMVIK